MRWTPRFAFDNGEAIDVVLLLPVRLWRYSDLSVGGEIESDAGHPASFVVVRSNRLVVPLRFYEDEWPTIRAMIQHGQTGAPITWFPDVLDDESFDVYLDEPAVGTDIAPEPDGAFPQAMGLSIIIRRINGEPFDTLEYFSEAA